MPPKKDDKKLFRGGRNKTKEEEITETIAPPSEKEIVLKEEYVNFCILISFIRITFLSVNM